MTAKSASMPLALHAELNQLWSSMDALIAAGEFDYEEAGPPRLTCDVPASIPGHVARFDEGVVLHAVRRRAEVPPTDQHKVRSVIELERWSAPVSTARRPDREATRAWVCSTRTAIDQILTSAHADDADLNQPIWWPLPLSGGWQTSRVAFEACCSHTWNHVVELWMRNYGPGEPIPDSLGPATNRALNHYASQISRLLDPERLARFSAMTVVMEFTGPGGGAWTFHVRDGGCLVREGWADDADVVITQSPGTFARTFLFGTQSQLHAVVAGDIRVSGSVRAALAFRRLFHLPWAKSQSHSTAG